MQPRHLSHSQPIFLRKNLRKMIFLRSQNFYDVWGEQAIVQWAGKYHQLILLPLRCNHISTNHWLPWDIGFITNIIINMCTVRKAIRFQSKSSDLSPTIISDQIFSDTLKAWDDVWQLESNCWSSINHGIHYDLSSYCHKVPGLLWPYCILWSFILVHNFFTSSCAGVFSVHSSIRSNNLLSRTFV